MTFEGYARAVERFRRTILLRRERLPQSPGRRRRYRETPDSYGIIYFNGSPIKNVSIDAKYSTPFAFAHEDFVRPTLTDRWEVEDFLTVNDRLSYLYRTLDVLGNGDSTGTKVSGDEVVGRQRPGQRS